MSKKKQSAHSFNQSRASAFRLARHHFTDQNRTDLLTVCRNVCGIQAQVMSAARTALWARMHYIKPEEIDSALWESRALVKTSAMRGTLHLLPSDDFATYNSALKRSRIEVAKRYMFRFGVALKEIDKLTETVMDSLSAGPMTRLDLNERIRAKAGKRLKEWMDQAWSAVRPAVAEGLICYGPPRGQEAVFVRVDQWLPKQDEMPEEEAKQILLRKFLSAYGPATLQDFSHWTGITMKEAKPVWDSLKAEFVEVDLNDKKASIRREDYDALMESRFGNPVLRLLPGFDPYLLAHADKSHLVDPSRYKQVYRNQGWISHVLLLNGRAIGIWSYAQNVKGFSIEVEPFEKISFAARAKLNEEAAAFAKFFNSERAPVQICFNNV